ncbi:MAG TPA: Fe-S cluster assembly protein SufD [Chitinophagaceae bacterium]|nr:Fe-S cluster assembly protein SufD [Chitinophagaceae bacterium]
MNTVENIKVRYQQLQAKNGSSVLTPIEENAFNAFTKLGIPTVRHEEWKYTRISSLFNKEYAIQEKRQKLEAKDLEFAILPGHHTSNVLTFVNGIYSTELSIIRSQALVVMPLEEAANNEYKEIVTQHLGHSSNYAKDGINALNTAFAQEGIFIQVKKGQLLEHPVYIYNITDARFGNVLAQPRCLFHVAAGAQVHVAESFSTIGAAESFTNAVMEVVIEKDAIVEYYKIQADAPYANQVSTTHFRQVGKSVLHTVTITLSGGIVRNNLSIAMEAEHSEADLHGLYFIKGGSHVDNHTVVDNIKPHCLSNELYKGVVDNNATAIFNGKIFVQKDAQKTNAFQSNKNILLSDTATINTKPQLEIFADDVKCSHGCTIGQLDDEGMFYLRSRGVSEKTAKSLLIHAFAIDILNHIKLKPLRHYVDGLISERLEISEA